MLGTWKDNCMTGEERTKLSFWYSKFLDNYSVNFNFSTIYSLQYCSHLTMYQASWYLKTNLPVCLFPHSNGIKIGPPCEELRGVSKLPRTLKHPVHDDMRTVCALKSTDMNKKMLARLRELATSNRPKRARRRDSRNLSHFISCLYTIMFEMAWPRLREPSAAFGKMCIWVFRIISIAQTLFERKLPCSSASGYKPPSTWSSKSNGSSFTTTPSMFAWISLWVQTDHSRWDLVPTEEVEFHSPLKSQVYSWTTKK